VPKRLSRSEPSETPPSDLDVSELGRLVRQKRTDEHLSLRQAAALARVSFSTLSRIEDGAQPDLSTFMTLCAWLGVDPSRFFAATSRRSQSRLDQAIEHLVTDPALTHEAADRIASVVRDLYGALAQQAPAQHSAPLALHLRGASVMRPGVPERLASVLKDMREALEQSPPT
jgi:transcriptional regulator with XRE-family HTH domain